MGNSYRLGFAASEPAVLLRALALALAVRLDSSFGSESSVVGRAPARAVLGNTSIFGGSKEDQLAGGPFLFPERHLHNIQPQETESSCLPNVPFVIPH